jgi:hypothetical protein
LYMVVLYMAPVEQINTRRHAGIQAVF